ncbi:ribonuclease HII [Clostridiales bacterium COT073_COT-073]|nr:ribonuclease HII [Clostridiales bacterium COT073_COT-073]
MDSIQEIKKEWQEILNQDKQSGYSGAVVGTFLEKYEKDLRAGVQQLCKKAETYREALVAERVRIKGMMEFEKKYPDSLVAGVDEVGRGPLAGPVVAGIVILDRSREILYLNDSKKLSDAKRRELAEEIKEKALAYSIGMASQERIDEINILQATYEAMTNAWLGLTVPPDILLNDAVIIPQIPIRQVAITKGDEKSVSIAAASILAKVTRDDIMLAYDELYPEYQFAKNKGYGTAEHIAAIKKYGLCELHRQSFVRNL